jgi:diguanylate cyclase (GGDEF)-like protein/PAS domain S-box-containing protein
MQCIAVFLALLLIPITGRAFAWIILSVAFLLMATRRTISLLFEQGSIKGSWLQAFSTEIVALTISILIVIGVSMIRKIFIQQRDDAEKVRTLSLAVEQNPGLTIIINIEGKIDYVNSSYCALTGNKLENVIGTIPDILNPELVDKNTLDNIWQSLNAGKVWEGEVHNKYNSGHLRWEKACVSPVKNDSEEITHYVIVLEDVTEQKEQREQLEYMALHDALTNLPNRTLFNDRLEQAIITAKRENEPLAVMLMDLNNFKEINDTMGHQIGDGILKEIGTRLLKVIRSGDTVARMGGDEFLLLLPAAETEKLSQFIGRINTIMEEPFIVGERSFEVRASIGISLFPEHGEDPEVLLKHADVAMYSAKSSAENFKLYDKSLDAGISGRLELTNSIRTAIEENQFMLHYQPLLNFSTGRIDSVEALIRWNHPDRGLLYPDSFIPLAEQAHHIGAITQWVIKNVFYDLSSWQKNGFNLGVSINISARDLLDPALFDSIKFELGANSLPASLITVEITESALMMHTRQTMNNLRKLRNIGVTINIDDFGTGYSSLQHLKRLPVTGLKIDKSFVMNMTNDENDAVIVRSTIYLAHNMGLKVVAEGIEKQDVFDIIEVLGCDYGQGYFNAKPMSADSLLDWLGVRQEKSENGSLSGA